MSWGFTGFVWGVCVWLCCVCVCLLSLTVGVCSVLSGFVSFFACYVLGSMVFCGFIVWLFCAVLQFCFDCLGVYMVASCLLICLGGLGYDVLLACGFVSCLL